VKRALAAFALLVIVVTVIHYLIPVLLVAGALITVRLILRHRKSSARPVPAAHMDVAGVRTGRTPLPKLMVSISPECLEGEHVFCEGRCGCRCGHDSRKILEMNEAEYAELIAMDPLTEPPF
jgi:hypothetical protein